ncbi:MAG: DUF4062 domain-containing protein, partial [Gemmatimonadales bacterium]|nr:DUF4062 domain-containing protein [Gemmatimonadales bacterium]
MQNLPVFVSSTFTDLQPYRSAVREALHRLEVVVRGMEYFGALPETPKDECLRIVRGCRAYVGVFAMRYGSVDPSSGKSFTHLEYDESTRDSRRLHPVRDWSLCQDEVVSPQKSRTAPFGWYASRPR